MNWLRKMNRLKIHVTWASVKGFRCRRYSQKPEAYAKQIVKNTDLSLIRNIGILAHVDAGKTTTTERMLYYSGLIENMGEVHHGNTVTDFMDQERQRGITITSASVSFNWGMNCINLLDTPGHIDFTMEVEQTLNVMDGAIVILDGSIGVEAQTVTVWKQANRYKIPRIVYINKMDKPGAEFLNCVNAIEKHLRGIPIVLQLPIVRQSKIEGIVDLLSLVKCEWDSRNLGALISRTKLCCKEGQLWEDAVKARVKLTETLSDLDDKLAETIIINGKELENVSANDIRDSVRKITLEQKGVPVLCGSSYKNIGVQLLMDAVVDYLPSPLYGRSQKIMECFGEELCARAFKVRHENYKGPVTFFRIYSGNLIKGQNIYNIKQGKSDQCGRLYLASADDYKEVPKISAGNIAAVTGLKFTTSGELVTSSRKAFQSAQTAMKGSQDIFFTGAFVPEPVFFCSVEASSQSEQGSLDKALSELAREDPSLKVTVNKETGQTVLGGMGELHLEIIRERIISDYKLGVYLGPLQIAYKETLIAETKGSHTFQQKIGNSVHFVNLIVSVLKAEDVKHSGKLLLDKSPECIDKISAISPGHLIAVKNGIESALECGPKLHCPVLNVNVMLHELEVGRGTSESVISSATSQCVHKLLETGGTRLLEPIMLVEISCDEKEIETVMVDLGKRRGEIESTETRLIDVVVRALVPLAELLGYSKELRILTSGTANFSMEFHSLKEMNPEEEAKAVKRIFSI